MIRSKLIHKIYIYNAEFCSDKLMVDAPGIDNEVNTTGKWPKILTDD
jgi:hypothetical protein